MFQLQMNAAWLAAALRNRIRRTPVCFGQVSSDQNEAYVVNRFEVAADIAVQRLETNGVAIQTPQGSHFLEPAHQVRIVQPVSVTLVTRQMLEAANLFPVEGGFDAEVSLFFRLSLDMSDGQPALAIDYDGVDLGTLAGLPQAGQILGAIEAYANQIPSPAIPLDFSALTDALNQPFAISNAGIAVNQAGTVLTIRAEVNGPHDASLDSWTQFYQGSIASHLGGADWALLAGKELLETALAGSLDSSLAGEPDTFAPSGPATASWNTGLPGLAIGVSGELPGACTACFGLICTDLNVDVDIDMDVIFSVPAPDTLQVNAKVHWDIDDGEALACVITAAQMWPAIGIKLAAEGKLGEYGPLLYLAGLAAGPIGVFIAALALIASIAPPLNTQLGDLQFQEVEDTDANAEYQAAITDLGLPAGFTLTGAAGSAGGLVLRGTLPPGVDIGHPPALEITGAPPQFTWKVGDCVAEPFAEVIVPFRDAGWQPNQPRTPMEICLAEVPAQDDPANQFRPFVTSSYEYGSGAVTVRVLYPDVSAAYAAQPYPCKLLLITNGGARLITIPALETISEEEHQELKLQAAVINAVACNNFAAVFWFDGFWPPWMLDPPPEHEFEQVWLATASQTLPGATLQVRNAAGEIAATATAGSKGQAQLVISTARAASGDRVLEVAPPERLLVKSATGSRRRAGGVEPSRAARAYVGVRQTLLLRDAEVRFARPIHYARASRVLGRPVVIYAGSGAVGLIDLSHAQLPRAFFEKRYPGALGAVGWNDGMVVWGARGAVYQRLAVRNGRPRTAEVDDQPVLDAAAHRGRLWLLNRKGLRVFDRSLHLVAELREEGAEHVRVTGNAAFLSGPGGLVRVHADSSGLRVAGRYSLAGIRTMGDPYQLPAGGEELPIETAGGARIVALGENGLIEERAFYQEPPWWMFAPRLGRTLVRFQDEGRAIGIYRRFGDRVLNAAEITAAKQVEVIACRAAARNRGRLLRPGAGGGGFRRRQRRPRRPRHRISGGNGGWPDRRR